MRDEREEGTFIVVNAPPELAFSERVDKWLFSATELSRGRIQHLLEEHKIIRNGQICKKKDKVRAMDEFKIFLNEDLVLKPVDMPLEIVYQDEHIAVINKEAGIPVHPGEGEDANAKVTLVHILLHHFPGQLSSGEGPMRPGIVHRLDKDTSGLLVVCKTNLAHMTLKEMLKTQKPADFEKGYWALVNGKVNSGGSIEDPIMRHPGKNKGQKMMVCRAHQRDKGKNAHTEYSVKKCWQVGKATFYTLLDIRIFTGRTHQIRVHMASISHPVVGDAIYGSRKSKTGALLLLAKRLVFRHPITKERIELVAKNPDYFENFMAELDRIEENFKNSNLSEEVE
ncbi:uncharacterized RNA pseudouridine synthase aq_1758-like [Schistocerca gregaria]|uniref:uncharacterized RNA pseudouridine synthase aq_1758-like n=1 Tax=Schistocerca gregaria TaxID=7010 RepID=UPI00211EC72C|nr:uncharacterized RNA pseudouridine synthase aq_1758-like [Schistocerca gregaria]